MRKITLFLVLNFISFLAFSQKMLVLPDTPTFANQYKGTIVLRNANLTPYWSNGFKWSTFGGSGASISKDTFINSASFALGSRTLTLNKNYGTAVQALLTGLASNTQLNDTAAALRTALNGKQPTLTAGANISILGNTISSTGGGDYWTQNGSRLTNNISSSVKINDTLLAKVIGTTHLYDSTGTQRMRFDGIGTYLLNDANNDILFGDQNTTFIYANGNAILYGDANTGNLNLNTGSGDPLLVSTSGNTSIYVSGNINVSLTDTTTVLTANNDNDTKIELYSDGLNKSIKNNVSTLDPSVLSKNLIINQTSGTYNISADRYDYIADYGYANIYLDINNETRTTKLNSQYLEIDGSSSLKLSAGGLGTVGQVLTADANGFAKWQAATGITAGGTALQYYRKNAANNGYEWATLNNSGSGYNADDTLTANRFVNFKQNGLTFDSVGLFRILADSAIYDFNNGVSLQNSSPLLNYKYTQNNLNGFKWRVNDYNNLDTTVEVTVTDKGLNVNGGVTFNVTRLQIGNTNYTVKDNDYTLDLSLIDATASYTINLPTAASCRGRILKILCPDMISSGTAVTNVNIFNKASATTNLDNLFLEIQSNGTNWLITSKY